MDSKFLSCVFATPPKVLGLQLKPFSCGHAVILSALGSPFINGGDLDYGSVVVAAWVCSKSFEECKQHIADGGDDLIEEWKAMGNNASKDLDLLEANRIFQKYLCDHLQSPKRWKRDEKKSSKAPWPLTVATILMKEFKMSEEQAWNMPMQMALWYFASLAEAHGDESLMSEEEQQRVEEARQLQKN